MRDFKLQRLEGWYGDEHDGMHPFRWMGKDAVLSVKGVRSPDKKILQITAGHPFGQEGARRLRVILNGRTLAEKRISPAFMSYLIPFEEEGDLTFVLSLDCTSRVPGDPRDLGIAVREANVLTLAEGDDPFYGEGWHDWEAGEFFPFRWISQAANIFLPLAKVRAVKYLAFAASSEYSDRRQTLSLYLGDVHLGDIPLLYRWNDYSLAIPALATPDAVLELRLAVNTPFPAEEHPEDTRELAVRIARLNFHNEDELHQRQLAFHKNALLNYQEMTTGKEKLESFPLNLGVDLYGRCNIKPNCVYCLWDWNKEEEGDFVDAVVDEKTLEGYGPFFVFSRNIINCSIGEPLLHPRFQEVIDACVKQGKLVEISTNGQAFTERTIRALVGQPIFLYISLDAACAETYAKIRNDRWGSIIPNLRWLAQERKKSGGLPRLHMVFIPMPVNRGDLEAYFQLCREIEADALVLRPLLNLRDPKIEEDRGGYHFDYKKELLGREELQEIFRQCEVFSKKYRVPVANQFSFGVSPDSETAKKGSGEVPPPRF